MTRAGKYVFHGEAGYSDIETLTGFRTNTICRLLSMSKARGVFCVMGVWVGLGGGVYESTHSSINQASHNHTQLDTTQTHQQPVSSWATAA